MDKFALPEGNWFLIIIMFTAAFSLAGLTSKWVGSKIPVLGRFGFFTFLSLTTGYFCGIVMIMRILLSGK